MRISSILFAVLATAVCVSSCNKEPKSEKPDEEKHVYIAGYYYDNAVAKQYTACCWIDGVRTDLTDADNRQTYAENIYVDDNNNVYVMGFYGSSEHACYWKNGKQVRLESDSKSEHGNALSILFVDGHTIVGGDDNERACIWIDGKRIQLCSEAWSSVLTMAWTSEGLVCEGYLTMDYVNVNPRKWTLSSLSSSPVSAKRTLKEIVNKFVKKGDTFYALSNGNVYDYYGERQLTTLPSNLTLYDFDVTEDGKIVCATMDNDYNARFYVDSKEETVCDLSGFSYSRFQSVAVSDGKYYIGAYLDDDVETKAYYISPDKEIIALPCPEGATTCTPKKIIVK